MSKSTFQRTFQLLFWSIFGVGIASVALVFFLIAHGVIGYMPPIEDLENPKDKFASEIISSDMQVLGRYYQSKANRIFVNYHDLSPELVKALIATEDVRFKDHSGIDAFALVRAVIKRGILGQKSAGGGSTISQQLAKLLYTEQADNVFQRVMQKPVEWVIAVQLERHYTKEEIINMYLNKFDFLNNAVGIKSAAYVYFGKNPNELNTQEAATLIGMCKNPSYFNPLRYAERTTGRRNTVLDQMTKADFITRADRDSLQQIPLTLHYNKADHKEGIAAYFRERLRIMMTAKKPVMKNYASWQRQQFYEDSISWEKNPLYGWCNKNVKADGSNYNIYTDGLKIYTTINAKMQGYAEEAVTEHMSKTIQPTFFKEKRGRKSAPFSKNVTDSEVESILNRSMRQSERYRVMKLGGASDAEIRSAFDKKVDMTLFSWAGMVDTTMTPMDSIRYMKHFARAGFMSMDPRNGHIKAYVGGIDFRNFQYDMVSVGRRQVGSTIKPFLYTLAMEEGFTPCDQMRNSQPRLVTETGEVWAPRNASNSRIGEMITLQYGLTTSNNWISAQLMSRMSPYQFVRLLKSFGIKSKLDPVVSLCLGPCEVTVSEMVSAYTAYPNRGVRVDPLFVTRIEDEFGNEIAKFTPPIEEVFSEDTADKMIHMLRGVIEQGTGGSLRGRYSIRSPHGGKTGTTNNNSDGWFMAFTPSLVSGTWVGWEDRSIHFDNIAEGQGARMALPIYGLFMQKVYADKSLGYSQSEEFEVGNGDPCGSHRSNQDKEEQDMPTMDSFFE
ncbi:MAG: transglycosylase domain-containing protein [Bacteroidales bacterium]